MIEITGKTKELLLMNTAYALADAMYDIKKVKAQKTKIIQFYGTNFEELYKNWITLLIQLVCTHCFLYKNLTINLKKKDSKGTAKVLGEPIDKKKHELKKEIKALTEHKFKLEKIGRLRRAVFVVDV